MRGREGAVLAAAIALALAAAIAAEARAQDTTRVREVVILHADSLAGEIVGGERVQRLVGNVALRQDSTWLWADRVVRFLDRDEIVFTGRGRIVDAADTLWAASVIYDRRTKTGRARGDVRLSDGDVVVTGGTVEHPASTAAASAAARTRGPCVRPTTCSSSFAAPGDRLDSRAIP